MTVTEQKYKLMKGKEKAELWQWRGMYWLDKRRTLLSKKEGYNK